MTNNMNKVSEELILSLKEQNEEKDRQLLSVETGFGVTAIVIGVTLILIGAYLANKQLPSLGMVVIVIGVLAVIAFAFMGVRIEQMAGYYKCAKCGHAYKPTYSATLMAPHIGRSRKMTCPCCKDKNYHKKVLSKD